MSKIYSDNIVSIIIPAYNREALIGETLDSILAQTYTHWECIVVDDGSTDHTKEVVQHYVNKDSRFSLFDRPNDHPKGANSCRNYGLEMSKGEYVNWFDSDDIMNDFFLEEGVKILVESKSDFVLFDYLIFEGERNNIIFEQINYTKNILNDYVTMRVNFGTWAIIWNRGFLKNNKFDEKLSRAQDLDFNFKAFVRSDFIFKYINKFGVLLRKHENNLTSQYKNNSLLSLLSELKVRRNIYNYLKSKNYPKDIILSSLKIYLNTLVKLLRLHNDRKIFSEIFFLYKTKKNSIRNFNWLIKVYIYIFLYKLVKRGDLKIKKIILDNFD